MPLTATTLTYQGETLTIAEWAKRLGLLHETIRRRVASGWPIERVLSTQRFGPRWRRPEPEPATPPEGAAGTPWAGAVSAERERCARVVRALAEEAADPEVRRQLLEAAFVVWAGEEPLDRVPRRVEDSTAQPGA